MKFYDCKNNMRQLLQSNDNNKENNSNNLSKLKLNKLKRKNNSLNKSEMKGIEIQIQQLLEQSPLEHDSEQPWQCENFLNLLIIKNLLND